MQQGILEKESGVPLDPAHAEVFLCGNPEMVKIATAMLQGKGFAAKGGTGPVTIHIEEYW
jgi:NAD(P)H-flavin reductase